LFDWKQTLGGNQRDEANAVIETSEKDLLLVGSTKGKRKVLWVVKLHKDGKPAWGKTYELHYNSAGNSVVETFDGNYVIAGFTVARDSTQRDMWVLKIDKSGELLWEKSFGGLGDDVAKAIVQTRDGGLVVAGFTQKYTWFQTKFWIMKLDKNGNFKWEDKVIAKLNERAFAIIEAKDGGLVLAGFRGNKMRMFRVIRFSKTGEQEWLETYRIGYWSVANSLIQTQDGAYVVVGYTKKVGKLNYDILLVKIDQNGQLLWNKTIGSNDWDEATSVTETYDKGLAVAGYSLSKKFNKADFWIMKLDNHGETLWEKKFDRRSLDFANSITETSDHGLVVAGSTFSETVHNWDYALLKYKNNDKLKFNFINPTKAGAHSTQDGIFTLKFCIQTQTPIESIEIYQNNSLFKEGQLRDFKHTANKKCPVLVEEDIALQIGENKIRINIFSMSGKSIKEQCTIYYVPIDW